MDLKCFRCSSWPCTCKDGQAIIHGDCREVLPLLEPVDLVLTDPPYGIAKQWRGGGSASHGWGSFHEEKGLRNTWDAIPADDELIRCACSLGRESIVWGGNYFHLPPSRCWLVWSKPERDFSLAEAELAWTNKDAVVRVFDWRRHVDGRKHPTQKPVELFKWCIELCECTTVLDPFLGSGTTLRACKDLGRRGIGIEIEERYCEIAANRLRQEVLF